MGGGEPSNFFDNWYENMPLDTVELYDPDTGMWSFTGNLNTAVQYQTATLLQNGKVLVLGARSAELYDPDTGTWSSAGSLGGNIGRFGHTSGLLLSTSIQINGRHKKE